MRCGVTELSGKDYRVKATHPRRPGPLRITGKDGLFIAASGQTCEHVSPEDLASMIANGYVEPVTTPAVPILNLVSPVESETVEDEEG